MDLSASLAAWDGKAVAPMETLYGEWTAADGVPEDLLSYLEADDASQVSSSWMLKRCVDEQGALSSQDSSGILARLEGLRPWEAKLHILQILHAMEVSAEHRYDLEDFLRACLAEKNKFVRAWTYNGFHLLAECYPELQREVRQLLEDAMETEAASVKARIRNLPGWVSV